MGCNGIKTIDLSNAKFSSLTSAKDIYLYCYSLEEVKYNFNEKTNTPVAKAFLDITAVDK